jgi:hypothetical protein
MRFMVFVPGGPESEAGAIPDTKLIAAMQTFNEELANAGVMLAGEGLHPTSKGVRLEFSGGKTRVIDGPFTESKELVAGFWMIEAPSLQDAIRWMQTAPFGGGVQLEIRPIFESEDFGKALTPELRERERRLRAKMAANRKS